VELDRRKVELAEPIRELGAVEVTVKLHADVDAVVAVDVVAE
jgi:ribosomal protein L9